MMNSTPETPDTPTSQPHASKIFAYFMFFFLVVAFFFGFVLVEPFMHTIILSAILAIIFSPLNSRLFTQLGERANLAAGLTSALVVVLILLPTAFLVWGLITEGMHSMLTIRAWADRNDFAEILRSHRLDPLLNWARESLPFITLDEAAIQAKLLNMTRNFTQSMLDASATLVGNMAKLVLRFFLMIFMIFYFLREGRGIVNKIKYLAPLRTHQEDIIIESLQRVSRAVLLGSLSIAVLQGLVGSIGLWIVGIPPLFWGTMMGLAALIPIVGTGLIWIPAAAYLYFFGEWHLAVFFVLFNVVIVTNIDTILRPMLMRKAAQVSPFYIFLAILGGIHAFGALGIIYGPLILTFLMVMIKIYGEEYKDVLTSRSAYREYRNEP
ncbi:MAG: AI-2E family transporter [Humidesulfovibrio sp.]|uniref:AI-2E family transporter n=1 Tax=Humidesulfovibrio sp. TaxID=2910988 RepID=UPI002735471C|nr:AI-2E family transporter [Humidesulfovibrio sp.]MDP2849034.1 AI-2E family transporter [Humidesulfovibrio sp.]